MSNKYELVKDEQKIKPFEKLDQCIKQYGKHSSSMFHPWNKFCTEKVKSNCIFHSEYAYRYAISRSRNTECHLTWTSKDASYYATDVGFLTDHLFEPLREVCVTDSNSFLSTINCGRSRLNQILKFNYVFVWNENEDIIEWRFARSDGMIQDYKAKHILLSGLKVSDGETPKKVLFAGEMVVVEDISYWEGATWFGLNFYRYLHIEETAPCDGKGTNGKHKLVIYVDLQSGTFKPKFNEKNIQFVQDHLPEGLTLYVRNEERGDPTVDQLMKNIVK